MKISEEVDRRADPRTRVMSHSTLGWFERSPAYFKFKVENPEVIEKTPALIMGKLFHALVLEPEYVAERFYIFDQEQRPEKDKTMASKENKLWKASELLNADGADFVSKSDYQNAQNMAEAVMKKAGEFIENGKTFERHLEWRRDEVDFKGFIDVDAPDYMVDLKTAIDANPAKWTRKAWYDYKSHRQAGMYLDGDADGFYQDKKEFYFIVIEKEPPYLVSVNMVHSSMVERGIKLYRELTADLKVCRERNKWPDFTPAVNIWN